MKFINNVILKIKNYFTKKSLLKSGRIQEIEGKFYDLKPANASFINVANSLRAMGVKNWYFMLEVKDLSVIDKVGTPEASKNDKKIIKECENNFWFFIREMVDGFVLDRSNTAMFYCALNKINSYTMNPRSCGKTFAMNAFLTWDSLKGDCGIISSIPCTNNSYSSFIKTHVKNEYKDKLIPKDEYKIIRSRPQLLCNRYKKIALDEYEYLNEEILDAIRIQTICDDDTFLMIAGSLRRDADSRRQDILNSMKWCEFYYDVDAGVLKKIVMDDKNNRLNTVGIVYTYKDLRKSEEWVENHRKTLGEERFRREILLDNLFD